MPSSDTVARPLDTTPSSPPTEADATRQAAWGQVRVHDVEVHPVPGTHVWSMVAARVCLGQLLPLDAVVELACEDGEGRPIGATAEPHRMCSDYSYENGTFVFIAQVSAAELARARQLRVCVRQAGGAAAGSTPAASACLTLPVVESPTEV